MAKTKYKINRHGDKVPVSAIYPIDKKRDAVVLRARRKWLRMFEQLAKLREDLFADAAAFLAYSAEKSGLEKAPTLKNLTITSYDGNTRVVVKSREFIVFDERLSMAEEIIMGLIRKWSAGAADMDKLTMTIQATFKRDKEGNVDHLRILSLQKLQIRDPEWRKAMNLINDARQVQKAKPYVMLQIRDVKKDKWTSLPLQLATADLNDLRKVSK